MIVKLVNSKDIFEVLDMNYGVERRHELYKFFCNPVRVFHTEDGITTHELEGLPIDRKYWPSLSQDPDLKYMLKKGLVKQIRTGAYSYSRTSYLVLNKGTK
jgi:hypothetical protein